MRLHGKDLERHTGQPASEAGVLRFHRMLIRIEQGKERRSALDSVRVAFLVPDGT
ncbi:MAG: hypothetical protein IOC35_08385 [Methylobacterium sp.]|jgi:hypothetical protein|nr:hypothetical protein [Methylobacterium sp.]